MKKRVKEAVKEKQRIACFL